MASVRLRSLVLVGALLAPIVGADAGALAARTATVAPGAGVEAPSSPAGPRAAACTESPFTAGFDAALRRRWPTHRITAALYDTRTGCQYRYRPELRITTASVLKTAIMGAVLLRAQRAGRDLTSWERGQIGPMISRSNDPAANALWSSLGGTSAMAAFDRDLGLGETTEASPWGLTSTSAADRNELLRQLVLGQWGPFSPASRATARTFLLGVTPSQRWGITAGVPSSWKVPLKNGFFPAACCGWRVNTSGVVERPDGSAYVATVLSDGWATEGQGIEAVEFVAKVVASWNLVSVGPHLSAARFAHQAYRDVLGRTPTFDEEQGLAWRIGTSVGRAGAEQAALLGDPSFDRTSGQILRLYLGALHRLPEAGTWSGRLAQVRAGTRTLTQVADAIAWSSELSGGFSLTTSAFVDRAYQQVYGRLPSAADRSYWVQRIDGGTPRGALLLGLVSSSTYRWHSGPLVRAATAYLTTLRRLPTADEQATAIGAYESGASSATLVGRLLQTTEYTRRFG